ncbi:hypothetical protein GCM10022271_14500 [Corallibacter vietnamensis]|uniref:tRNA_anti-like n=1 Tax=Corallibacter vietnamensis TaxID=904130 RepID=A0ABP7H8F7_9FLAO
MKVKRLKIIAIILVIQISGFYLIYKNVVQPPVSIEDVKSDYNHSVKQFYLEFVESNVAFDRKYLNKVISLTGNVTVVQDSVIILNNKIVCIANEKFNNTIKDKTIKVKGKYVGYDELFDNLKMDECVIELL